MLHLYTFLEIAVCETAVMVEKRHVFYNGFFKLNCFQTFKKWTITKYVIW